MSAMASLLTASLEAVCLSSRHAPGAQGSPPRQSALLLVLPEIRVPLALERLTQAALLNYRCSTWSGTYSMDSADVHGGLSPFELNSHCLATGAAHPCALTPAEVALAARITGTSSLELCAPGGCVYTSPHFVAMIELHVHLAVHEGRPWLRKHYRCVSPRAGGAVLTEWRCYLSAPADGTHVRFKPCATVATRLLATGELWQATAVSSNEMVSHAIVHSQISSPSASGVDDCTVLLSGVTGLLQPRGFVGRLLKRRGTDPALVAEPVEPTPYYLGSPLG